MCMCHLEREPVQRFAGLERPPRAATLAQRIFKEDNNVLIFSRREAECVCLGDDVVLTIVSVGSDKVRIGVQAPSGVRILRSELEIVSATEPTPIADAGSVPQAAPLLLPVSGSQVDSVIETGTAIDGLLLPPPPTILPVRGPLGQHLRKAIASRRAA
jgi:carbon storage regulator